MEPIILVFAAIVFGPPALLTYLLYKYIYLKMSQADRRDFLIGFFGAILINVLLAGSLFLSRLLVSNLVIWKKSLIARR